MFRSSRLHLLFLTAIALTAMLSTAHAADEVFATDAGAIRGYDPVAYHTESKPVPGSPDITHVWSGATWRFASDANRKLFVADPERYAPRYGGFCAYGTSRGYKVSTQPEAFAIVDGKLYLNYSKAVQTTWNQNRPHYIDTANHEWTVLEHTAYTPETR